MGKRIALSFLVLLMSAGAAPAADPTAEQAIWLLKKATLIHRDGSHNLLLRSLRQMRDPQLEPLFSELVQRRFPTMQVHGMLGLAEISPKQRLDLALLANIEQPMTQAQLVSAALDADMLNTDDCRQIINWPGLDPSVKVIVAAKLIGDGEKFDPALLDEAQKSDNLGLSMMAAMMKLQLGQSDMAAELAKLNRSDAPNREPVRLLLLQTAMRYKFDKLGTWALKMLGEENLDRSLAYRALRTALMFQPAQAAGILTQRFEATDNPAERIRLGIMALNVADQLDPRVFDPMLQCDQELVQQIARVGKALAAKKPAHDELVKLIHQYNVLASRWVFAHAADLPAEKARPIYIELIRTAQKSPVHFRPQAMELVVMSCEKLYESGSSTATLRELIGQVNALSQEAILMGLIRSHTGDSSKVIAGLNDWGSEFAGSLALLLRAKHGQKLNDDQMLQLSTMVRGGIRDLQNPLRIQAAWIYLKLTRQDRVALASVLGSSK